MYRLTSSGHIDNLSSSTGRRPLTPTPITTVPAIIKRFSRFAPKVKNTSTDTDDRQVKDQYLPVPSSYPKRSRGRGLYQRVYNIFFAYPKEHQLKDKERHLSVADRYDGPTTMVQMQSLYNIPVELKDTGNGGLSANTGNEELSADSTYQDGTLYDYYGGQYSEYSPAQSPC
jgi:hypothetical protein